MDRDRINLHHFLGFSVYLDPTLVEPKEVQVRRPWRERIFSRNPWRATTPQVIQVPSRQVVRLGTKLVMHPETFEALTMRTQQEEQTNV